MEHLILEREAEAKEAESAYPEAMRNITRHYSGRRAHLVNGTMVMECSVRAQDIAKEYCAMAEDSALEKEYREVPGSNDHQEFDPQCTKQYGLGAQRLAREYRGETRFLQRGLEEARAELEKTGLKEALEENMVGLKKKRRRKFNEHEGDWDLDRKWDTAPFMSTFLSRVEFPYIEIIFPINMNSDASGETISRFNARCLALAEIFERAGYRIAIAAEGWGKDIFRAQTDNKRIIRELGGEAPSANDSVMSLSRFVLRDANEYGDIQSFAAYSSVAFFRRTVFACTYNALHYIHAQRAALNSPVSYSFGQALDKRPIPSGPGQLVLTRDLVSKLFGMNKAEAAKIFQERVAHVVSRSA